MNLKEEIEKLYNKHKDKETNPENVLELIVDMTNLSNDFMNQMPIPKKKKKGKTNKYRVL